MACEVGIANGKVCTSMPMLFSHPGFAINTRMIGLVIQAVQNVSSFRDSHRLQHRIGAAYIEALPYPC